MSTISRVMMTFLVLNSNPACHQQHCASLRQWHAAQNLSCQHTGESKLSKVAAMSQVEVHPNFRNERTIDWCNQEGIHVTAYAPLSSPQTMSSQKKSVPNLLKVSHICTPPAPRQACLWLALAWL